MCFCCSGRCPLHRSPPCSPFITLWITNDCFNCSHYRNMLSFWSVCFSVRWLSVGESPALLSEGYACDFGSVTYTEPPRAHTLWDHLRVALSLLREVGFVSVSTPPQELIAHWGARGACAADQPLPAPTGEEMLSLSHCYCDRSNSVSLHGAGFDRVWPQPCVQNALNPSGADGAIMLTKGTFYPASFNTCLWSDILYKYSQQHDTHLTYGRHQRSRSDRVSNKRTDALRTLIIWLGHFKRKRKLHHWKQLLTGLQTFAGQSQRIR